MNNGTQQNHATPDQHAQWATVCEELEAKGVTPSQVRAEVLKRTSSEQSTGLFGWASNTVNSPITWKGVLYFALGLIAFAGLLKLVGMAFNINIPLLHTATPTV